MKMLTSARVICIISAMMALVFVGAPTMANPTKAKDIVEKSTPATVQESTGTKRSPVGDKVSDYKPPVKISQSAPPPSPTVDKSTSTATGKSDKPK